MTSYRAVVETVARMESGLGEPLDVSFRDGRTGLGRRFALDEFTRGHLLHLAVAGCVFNDLLRDPAIAESLFLSKSAVKKHVSAIFYKLGLSEERHVHRRVAPVLALLREAGPGDGEEALRRPSELQEGG